MSNFVFNPLDYGYEPLFMFPEISQYLPLLPLEKPEDEHIFLRVTFISGPVRSYLFSLCIMPPKGGPSWDERIKFRLSSFDGSRDYANDPYTRYKGPQYLDQYYGLVSTKEFADQLLPHLFANYGNETVAVEGKERFEENLNEKLRNTIWSK